MTFNMEGLLSVASKVGTPLALSGIIVIVLYALYKQVLALKLFTPIGAAPTSRLLHNVLNKLFWLALLALGLGVASYLVIALFPYHTPAPLSEEPPDAARRQLGQLSYAYTPAAFVESAKHGDVSAVKLFLAAGMDPNATNDKGATALMYAALKDSKASSDILHALLKAQAEVNKKDPKGNTALVGAAEAGTLGTLRVLLDHGANAGAINRAFVAAARGWQRDSVRLLMDRGADVKELGVQALMGAIGSRPFDMPDQQGSDTVQFVTAQPAASPA